MNLNLELKLKEKQRKDIWFVKQKENQPKVLIMMTLVHRYARYLFIILTFILFSSEVRRVISSLSIDLQC
jgi:hypothetical protein